MSLLPKIFATKENWMDDFFTTDRLIPEWLSRTITTPAVNVKQNNGMFEVEVAAPGLKKEDFKIEVENNLLCISSEKKEETEETKDDYTRKEFSYASFKRVFTLPENADSEDISANYEDGVLKITLPKLEVEAPKNVKTIPVS